MAEGDSSLSQSRAFYAPLLQAALEDDWEAAEAFIQKNPNYDLGAPITKEEGTALHNAAAAKRTRFVKELVKRMTPEQLEVKTKPSNCTALYFAAQSEIVTIAEVMVKKNKYLPLIPKDAIEFLPLYAAIKTGNRDMVSYLYSVTPIQELNSLDHINLLNATISTDLYDMAHKILDILKPAPEEKKYLWLSLEMLAKKPSEIGSKSQPSAWERRLNSCFSGRFCNKALMQASAHHLVDRLWKRLIEDDTYFSPTAVGHDQHMMKLVVEAAKVGNVEFLIILIRSYPDLIWQVDEEYGSLFHVAVKHRQERVFNLIYEIGVLKDNLASLYAEGNKSMLHLAGELPSTDRLNIVSGAALQMQRELLWFQEIEKIVPKSLIDDTNKKGETPRDIFARTHEELQKNGEEWMKNTANSCMVVAALIATVVFPAAFTVPGCDNQETGIPIFLESNWFTLFLVSDAVAMLFSSPSILVFLTILTSRYTEKDFLKSLPLRLALGLAMLLISIVGMLIAFSAACFLVFKSKTSVPIRIIVADCSN
ncbi:ankyrin repeat-containing protein At5g02620-like [Juglans microcarpa x Juglans regia]|uniref:ankyrin repeat-containing protein At5g02620-like n=1 Tax=Juglans microcarpa x Juglans regia TaxID=2249226 RepID=UPI001B7F6BD8|nr:ankyrin repeat-containing protein At5g02620-like [Juglans microcarpa x Juglans regia]